MQTTATPVMASVAVREALVQHREKTLEQLYAKAYPMVLHYIRQHSGTAADAQDLLQESIILFYEKVMQEEFTLTAAPTTYIMAVCKNLWLRELDKRKRQQELTPEQSEQMQDDATAATVAEAQALSLAAFVEQLGERCREVLVSFYYLGQRMEQLAEKLGYSSVRSATVQKYKCLERLRKSVAGYRVHDFRE